MALRKQNFVSAIGNENVGIMQNGINLKNLASRPKQPLGNLNNIIHNQAGRNGTNRDVGKQKKHLVQTKAKSIENSKLFKDEFLDFCSFKRDDKSLEEKWLEDEFVNSNIFDKIIEADKPRSKPITKKELDHIQYFEFGEQNNDIFEVSDLKKLLDYEEIEIPQLPCFNLVRPPSPPSDLFKDLELSAVEDIWENENESIPTPMTAANFDDLFNF